MRLSDTVCTVEGFMSQGISQALWRILTPKAARRKEEQALEQQRLEQRRERTAALVAVLMAGDFSRAETLLQEEVDKTSALSDCARNGAVEATQWLLKRGARVRFPWGDIFCSADDDALALRRRGKMHMRADLDRFLEVGRLFVENGTDINYTDAKKFTPVVCVVEFAQAKFDDSALPYLLSKLVDLGANARETMSALNERSAEWKREVSAAKSRGGAMPDVEREERRRAAYRILQSIVSPARKISSFVVVVEVGGPSIDETFYVKEVLKAIGTDQNSLQGVPVEVIRTEARNPDKTYAIGFAAERGWNVEKVSTTPFQDADKRRGIVLKHYV